MTPPAPPSPPAPPLAPDPPSPPSPTSPPAPPSPPCPAASVAPLPPSPNSAPPLPPVAAANTVGPVTDQILAEVFVDRVVDGFAQRAVDPVLLIGMNGLQERRVEPRCGIRRCCGALSRVACSGYGIRSGTRAGYRAGGRTNTGDRIRWQRQPLIECATA